MTAAPLTMRQAAVALGISYRAMIDVVGRLEPNVHYDLRGTGKARPRRVFYPDQI